MYILRIDLSDGDDIRYAEHHKLETAEASQRGLRKFDIKSYIYVMLGEQES